MTVADEWQGRGLGPALLARLLDLARAEGLTALRASVLAVNARSLAMLRNAGFRACPVTGALLEYELDLTPGDGPRAADGGAVRSRRQRAAERLPRAIATATPATTSPSAPTISATMLSVSDEPPSALAAAGAGCGLACWRVPGPRPRSSRT